LYIQYFVTSVLMLYNNISYFYISIKVVSEISIHNIFLADNKISILVFVEKYMN